MAEAAHQLGCAITIPLAVDSNATCVRVFRSNFPTAAVHHAAVESIFDGKLGARLTQAESTARRQVGTIHFLVGGPPCQGHSDLNNHTRRRDPRNASYLRIARAAEVVRPTVVLIENVPSVRHDRGGVVAQARSTLVAAGYRVADGVIDLSRVGVPQRRRRHSLLAVRDSLPDPTAVLGELSGLIPCATRSVRWAIGDLENAAARDGFEAPSRASHANRRRIDWLFGHGAHDLPNNHRPPCHQGDHSYVSMYGRLRWDKPAQTITTGYGSMGQGRYVHPSRPRTLTPHEAARLQFFPDWFNFSPARARRDWAKMIGNAVPAKLTMALGRSLALRALEASHG